MESFDQMRTHVSGKADRAEGLLRLRDMDTSLITFRQKVTLVRINDSAIDRQVVMLETRGEKTQLFKRNDKVFKPRRPRKSMRMLQTNCSCRFGHRQGE
jgi:hypothetical protein